MRRLRRRSSPQSGQATVELVALLPLIAAVAVAICQVLAAGAARELARQAADAAAVAMLQGGDARAAAREAVPGWARGALTLHVRGRTVDVSLRPRGVPGVRELLIARAEAVAGR